MRKKIRAGIALLLAGLTTCFAGACVNQGAINETLALQQRLEELQQQNSSMLAEKDSLQQQFDELSEQNQAVLDELKGLEDTIYGPPLESGFYYDISKGAFGSPYATDKVGLKSDRSRFDIDDVTLDFYIGAAYFEESDKEKYEDGFDIYFSEEDYLFGYFVKTVEEPFSEEYVYKHKKTIEYDDFYRYEIEMEKHYTLTVPKEIFYGNAGHFYLIFRPSGLEEGDDEVYPIFYHCVIYYKIEYGKVVLSRRPFKEWVGESYWG